MSLAGIEKAFKKTGWIAIVGASLTGLRAAEALRREGFRKQLVIVGEEAHEPYDQPPLSKQVALGDVPANRTALPRLEEVDADWRFSVSSHRSRPQYQGGEVGKWRLSRIRLRPSCKTEASMLQKKQNPYLPNFKMRSRPKKVLTFGSRAELPLAFDRVNPYILSLKYFGTGERFRIQIF